MVNRERPRVWGLNVVVNLPVYCLTISRDLQRTRGVTITTANLSPPPIPNRRRSERHQTRVTPRRELQERCASRRLLGSSAPPSEYGTM